MARWQPGARERLERAALDLFAAQGFAATTIPQITARAGLTTRTFFRHYADKREVLFKDDDQVPALVTELLRNAPPHPDLMALIAWGLRSTAAVTMDGQYDYMKARRAVIRTDDGLYERDLRKRATLAKAITDVLCDFGFDELVAAVVGSVAVTVFSTAVDRWLDHDGQRPLQDCLDDTLAAFQFLGS